MPDKNFQIRGPITAAEESVYIERVQDREVLSYLHGANYITVLGARQTGKTSLLYHLIQQLPADQYSPILIDLSPVRDADKGQFYRFVSGRIAAQLGLDDAVQMESSNAPSQIEFQDFIKRVAEHIGPSKRIVIMLDEFEAVPDDLREGFFGTIRTFYNERGIQEEFARYLFILAGATDPNTLIAPDSGLSPFNISQKVYLLDFDLQGIEEMVQHMGISSADTAKSVAASIFAQTQGHPNLSSKLCLFVKEHPGTSIDAAVESIINSGDENIYRVVEGLKRSPEETRWVEKIVRQEESLKFDRSSALVTQMELQGLIRRDAAGNCAIRNPMYEAVCRNQLKLGNAETAPLQALAVEPVTEAAQDVFISYTRNDEERVLPLVQMLRDRGVSVWWDRKISPGEAFDEVIEQALKSVRCVIVVWSIDSVKNNWVKNEATEGAQRDILVPMLIDDVAIPLEFRRIQAANLIGWPQQHKPSEMARLLDSIAGLVERPLGAAKVRTAGSKRAIIACVELVCAIVLSMLVVNTFAERLSGPIVQMGAFMLVLVFIAVLADIVNRMVLAEGGFVFGKRKDQADGL